MDLRGLGLEVLAGLNRISRTIAVFGRISDVLLGFSWDILDVLDFRGLSRIFRGQ